MRIARTMLCLLAALGCVPLLCEAQVAPAPPQKDGRAEGLMDPNRFQARLPKVETLEQWEVRKKAVREQLLLSAGLWPLPQKPPLNAQIFDVRQGEGFTVAKVYFESLEGFLVTGNLYRPSIGKGPFPAIVNAHGHWPHGRLMNSLDASVPGRCIDFARMGFVVFSLDMVGYLDSFQLPHDTNKTRIELSADEPLPYEPRLFRAEFDFPKAELYGLSLGGLQLWNCIRAVDFLSSLPEVDPSRIGATGASGGASQTIFLMIADERVQAAAPVNIIGAAKHPGCRCENMPGLWRGLTTIELAAAFSPKPLLLVSATEDPWTNRFPGRELPIFQRYYGLYGAVGKVKNVHVSAGHNYNAESRAAVYEWFSLHLKSGAQPIANPAPISRELKALGDLRVFPDKLLPKQALSGAKIVTNWTSESESALQKQWPASPRDLDTFISVFVPKLATVLSADNPRPEDVFSRVVKTQKVGHLSHETAVMGRRGLPDAFQVGMLAPAKASGTVVVADADGRGGFVGSDGRTPTDWAAALVAKGFRVMQVGGFVSGELAIPQKTWDSFSWASVYNRDNTLNAIQDVLTALQFAKRRWPQDRLVLVGLGRLGLPAAMAGAIFQEAGQVLIDLNRTDPGYDGELLKLLPVGSIRRVGDLRTAAISLMRHPLTLLNPGPTFDSGWYERQARQLGLTENLKIVSADIGAWVSQLRLN